MTTIKLRRDTEANFSSTNPVLAEGEPAFVKDKGYFKIGDGITNFNNLPAYINKNDFDYIKRLDVLYEGVDLSTKFASEIANYASVWHWIQARKNANNFEGIHVGDKIPLPLSAGTISDGTTTYTITAKTLYAQIAGIDTYCGYGDQAVGHHIDFITTNTIGTNIPWNPANNNNGTAEKKNPWLSSQIYACLNGVNNASTNAYGNVKHGFDASSGGVLQLLPSTLQAVIIEKRGYIPERYSASGTLTSSPSASWQNIGKLWLPTECEVASYPVNSADKASDGCDRNTMGLNVQYPLFAGCSGYRVNRVKSRVSWWLSSVTSGSASRACSVAHDGGVSAFDCTTSWSSAPVCFRI